jgi:hypothetical protein
MVGTADLAIFVHSSQPPGVNIKATVLSAKPGAIVRGTHPSKIAKGGAASVGMVHAKIVKAGLGGWPRLLILRALPTQWVPRSFASLRRGEPEIPAPSEFDHEPITNPNSTRSIAVRPPGPAPPSDLAARLVLPSANQAG